ncbi:PQQ-binding-like beta-propeller repeat protein [Nocardiopsis sp. CA-288880]|uniref:outer membrane protein assembly factor BamB family protein n=1 Tax=Nocardiopsis sp. CA-288880 TaxID=3239995 RepID=UPI003D952E66
MCLGERAPECEDRGELRWSVPLEGEYYLRGAMALHHPETGAIDSMEETSFHAVEADPGVLYAENALLRMVDVDTGELVWTTDLRQDPDLTFVSSGLRDIYSTSDHVLLHFNSGFVRIDSEDGSVAGSAPLTRCTGRLSGLLAEDQVVVRDCGRDEDTYSALDVSAGQMLWEFQDQAPEEEVPFRGSARVAALDIGEGPTSAVSLGGFSPGPAGLGTLGLTRVEADSEEEAVTVAVACAPDGVGRARPDAPSPGVVCHEPRLYAVNTG